METHRKSTGRHKAIFLLNELFRLSKREALFLVALYILPTIYWLTAYFSVPISPVVGSAVQLFAPAYLLLALFVYKRITKCSEFELFKVAFQFILILAVLNLLSLSFILRFAASPTLLILAKILHELSFVISFAFGLIGIISFFYQERIKLKQLLLLYIASTIITVLSSIWLFYQKPTIFSSILNVKTLVGSLSGVFLFYSFQKIKHKVELQNRELPFFIFLGLCVFSLEYLSSLLLVQAALPNVEHLTAYELFIDNLQFFVFYLLWGSFLTFYNHRKNAISF